MNELTSEEISLIINIALASRKIKKLTVKHKELRPNIHLILFGRIGSTKSSILYDVSKKINTPVVTGLTTANLYGILDKEGELIPPTIWECKENFLMIDEYHLDTHNGKQRDLLNSLLSVMENPEYTKKVSYRARPFKQKSNNLFCKIEKGRLMVKTRFSLFLNTMMPITTSSTVELQALCSRCLCVPIYPDEKVMKEIARGKHLYLFEDLQVQKEKVEISKEEYDAILSFVERDTINLQGYLRKIGDLCRAYAVIGKLDENVFNTILKLP